MSEDSKVPISSESQDSVSSEDLPFQPTGFHLENHHLRSSLELNRQITADDEGSSLTFTVSEQTIVDSDDEVEIIQTTTTELRVSSDSNVETSKLSNSSDETLNKNEDENNDEESSEGKKVRFNVEKVEGRKRRGSIIRTKSVPASIFLEATYYRCGFLTLIDNSMRFSSNKKRLYFKLTANFLAAARSPEMISDTDRAIDLSLNKISQIKWIRDCPHGEFAFKISVAESKELLIVADSLKDMAEWIVAIDGLVSNLTSNSFNTYMDPMTDKKTLLQILYKDSFRGGTVNSSYDEEWVYEPNGTITCVQINDPSFPENSKIQYEWDGERFLPASDSLSFGAGQWSGVFIGWYLEEWMLFKTGQREKFLKYFFDQKEKEYRPEFRSLTAWKWTRHFLASKFNEGEWIVEGEIPEPVVMFLQMIRYSRIGYKEINDIAAAVAVNESVEDSEKNISGDNVEVVGSGTGSRNGSGDGSGVVEGVDGVRGLGEKKHHVDTQTEVSDDTPKKLGVTEIAIAVSGGVLLVGTLAWLWLRNSNTTVPTINLKK